MTTTQQFLDAVADFEALVAGGSDCKIAVQQAAESAGMEPALFEQRLTRDMSLETRAEKIRHDANYNRFLAAARAEVDACKRREQPYSRTHLFDAADQILKITEVLCTRLGRPPSEHEIWKIGEMLDPIGTELRLKTKNPEMIKELLRRQIG